MEPFDWSLYKHRNPICPHLTYECIKRIFGRPSHSCLSGNNKHKAVEVVLKFVKLHDGFNFDDRKQILSYFDHYIDMDFMRYKERPPLLQNTLDSLVEAYNATPPNFQNPPDSIIENVIEKIVHQMQIDQENSEAFYSSEKSTAKTSNEKTGNSNF